MQKLHVLKNLKIQKFHRIFQVTEIPSRCNI